MGLTDRQRRAWARHREVGCPADGENIACWGPTLEDYAWVDAHKPCAASAALTYTNTGPKQGRMSEAAEARAAELETALSELADLADIALGYCEFSPADMARERAVVARARVLLASGSSPNTEEGST